MNVTSLRTLAEVLRYYLTTTKCNENTKNIALEMKNSKTKTKEVKWKASQGDYAKQSKEYQESKKRWRKYYIQPTKLKSRQGHVFSRTLGSRSRVNS